MDTSLLKLKSKRKNSRGKRGKKIETLVGRDIKQARYHGFQQKHKGDYAEIERLRQVLELADLLGSKNSVKKALCKKHSQAIKQIEKGVLK